MGAENQTRITIETERILITVQQHAVRRWCDKCATEVESLPSIHAGRLAEHPEALKGHYRSELHLDRAKDELLICVKSLLRLLQAASGYRNS